MKYFNRVCVMCRMNFNQWKIPDINIIIMLNHCKDYFQKCWVISDFKTLFPEKKILFKSQPKNLVGLFVLFLLFCFPLLKLQVFSQSFALTGEDQLESSLLATMWDWKGEVAAGSAAAVILYLCNNTPGWGRVHNMPISSSCEHCSTISDLTPEWTLR